MGDTPAVADGHRLEQLGSGKAYGRPEDPLTCVRDLPTYGRGNTYSRIGKRWCVRNAQSILAVTGVHQAII